MTYFNSHSTVCSKGQLISRVHQSLTVLAFCTGDPLLTLQKIKAMHYLPFCVGNASVTCGFPTQRVSTAESVSISCQDDADAAIPKALEFQAFHNFSSILLNEIILILKEFPFHVIIGVPLIIYMICANGQCQKGDKPVPKQIQPSSVSHINISWSGWGKVSFQPLSLKFFPRKYKDIFTFVIFL